MLAYNSKAFYNTSLGQVYEKVTNDDKYKSNLKWRFDSKNHCTNYEGQALLSHYHEAAYDAHMTGVVFMHLLKHKEIEQHRMLSRKGKKPGGHNDANSQGAAAASKGSSQMSAATAASEPTAETAKNPKELKNQMIVLQGPYPRSQINKMMMDAQGTGRFYHLEPEKHVALV